LFTLPKNRPALLNRLRMRQVALLLAIQEHRTLRAAAHHLGVTQPAASKMLHELEDAVGEALFDRIGRGLQLNPAGLAVINTFRGLRNSLAALSHELHELRLGSAGKLFVGSIMVATPNCLNDALIGLKRIYPLLSIEVLIDTSDRLVELLHKGTLDVVIGRMPETASAASQECVFRAIGEETISVVAACTHPLARRSTKKRLSFAALLAYPWILQPRGSPSRTMVEQEFLSHHVPLPRGLIETTSILIASNLIASSEMVAAMPLTIASQYEKHGLLRILPYTFTHTLTPWGSLVHRDRAINPIAQRFMDLLHAGAGN
jgi:DNA-binding transcriptional LysR family regulator